MRAIGARWHFFRHQRFDGLQPLRSDDRRIDFAWPGRLHGDRGLYKRGADREWPAVLAGDRDGGLAAACSGIIVGIPAIRIRGIYLIILTLGFGEIVRVFFLNFSYTGGANGLARIAPYTNVAWVGSACLVTGLVSWRLRYARIGRAMIAVHADEIAAQAMGVNMVRVKLVAFALGAFIAGLAGAFYAHYTLFIDSAQFGFLRSADAFLFIVLGGIANPVGPVGAAVATLTPEIFRFLQDWRMTFFGALLIAAALWRPDGLVSAFRTRQ